jgi:hypothetical protein
LSVNIWLSSGSRETGGDNQQGARKSAPAAWGEPRCTLKTEQRQKYKQGNRKRELNSSQNCGKNKGKNDFETSVKPA